MVYQKSLTVLDRSELTVPEVHGESGDDPGGWPAVMGKAEVAAH